MNGRRWAAWLRRGGIPVAVAMVVLAMIGLPGCGGGGSGVDTIVLWEQRDPQERTVMEWALENFRESHPDVTIDVVHYDTETLRTQFQTAALAGGGPDIVYGPSDQVGPFSVLRIIQPLEDFLPATFWDRLVPGAVDSLAGHVWALPDQLGNHLCLLYNTRLVPEPPGTFDELIRIAKQVTVADGGRIERYGLALQLDEPFWLVPFLTAYGGWVMDDANRPTLNSDAMVSALQFLKDLKVQHEVVPRESNYELMDTLFKQEKAAMIVNGPWSFGDYEKAGIPFGVARLPRVRRGGAWAAPMIGSKGYSINANLSLAKKAIVLELLDYLTSVEVTGRFATELGILPSVAATYDDPAVQEKPILQASRSQWEVGRRMPVVPEMRVVWDSMRPHLQGVMNGSEMPVDAAKRMQGEAVQKIEAMRR